MAIANANQLNITAALIYDNIPYPGSNPVVNPTVGSTSTPNYPNPLPAVQNIANMSDNNIMTGALTIAVYFASNAYGTNLSAMVDVANANSITQNKQVWLFRPVVYPTCWTNCPDVLNTMLAASKGYLSYIIGLAAVFLIGAVAIRWWRMRRLRGQLALRGDLEHGIALRNRASKVHPLPVDILNTYPVETYSPSIIKNTSCAICLDDFTPDKTANIRVLPCGHGFCTGCIDPWLTDKSPLCPICKYDCLPADLRKNADLVEQNNVQLGSASPFASPSAAAAAALANSSEAEAAAAGEAAGGATGEATGEADALANSTGAGAGATALANSSEASTASPQPCTPPAGESEQNSSK